MPWGLKIYLCHSLICYSVKPGLLFGKFRDLLTSSGFQRFSRSGWIPIITTDRACQELVVHVLSKLDLVQLDCLHTDVSALRSVLISLSNRHFLVLSFSSVALTLQVSILALRCRRRPMVFLLSNRVLSSWRRVYTTNQFWLGFDTNSSIWLEVSLKRNYHCFKSEYQRLAFWCLGMRLSAIANGARQSLVGKVD